jgi:hypothetical protein
LRREQIVEVMKTRKFSYPFDYLSMDPVNAAKVQWAEILFYVNTAFLGVVFHVTGFHYNHSAWIFTMIAQCFFGLVWLVSLLLYFRAYRKNDYFDNLGKFILDTGVFLLFEAGFAIDAYFLCVPEPTEGGFTIQGPFWPFFFVELPVYLVFVYYLYRTDFRFLERVTFTQGYLEEERMDPLGVSHLGHWVGEDYVLLIQWALEKMKLQDAKVKAAYEDNQIKVTVESGGLKTVLDFDSLITDHLTREWETYQSDKSLTNVSTGPIIVKTINKAEF